MRSRFELAQGFGIAAKVKERILMLNLSIYGLRLFQQSIGYIL